MKKLEYIYESSSNLLSIRLLIAIGILLEISFITFIIKDHSLGNLFPAIIVLLLILFGFYELKEMTSQKKYDKEAIEKGTKVKGIIDSPIVRIDTYQESVKNKKYYLLIKYKDPNTKKEVEFTTPELNFNPYSQLASQECSVYVYEDNIYVTDFIGVKNKGEGIWEKDNPDNDKPSRLFTILFVIAFSIPLLLCLLAIIGMH